MEHKERVVNIRAALKASKSKFIRNLPGFVAHRISRIVREKELNEIHKKIYTLDGMDYVKALLFDEFKIKINIIGEENVEKDKKYVYVANHPLGGIDALSHLYLINKIHGKVISPSNELFEFIPNLHPLIVGVNVFGQNTKEKARAVNDAFESDAQIMIFPAGKVSRKFKDGIYDTEWQKTFVTKALQSKRDIVPVFISGQNSNKFYRIANMRKKLGIKLFIETMFLPQEMLKQRNMEITLTIGKPISEKEIRESGISHIDWTQKIKKVVYSMKK